MRPRVLCSRFEFVLNSIHTLNILMYVNRRDIQFSYVFIAMCLKHNHLCLNTSVLKMVFVNKYILLRT